MRPVLAMHEYWGIKRGGGTGNHRVKETSGSRSFLLEKPIFIEINYILLNLDIVGITGPQRDQFRKKVTVFTLNLSTNFLFFLQFRHHKMLRSSEKPKRRRVRARIYLS